jgi:hypothetical protein
MRENARLTNELFRMKQLWKQLDGKLPLDEYGGHSDGITYTLMPSGIARFKALIRRERTQRQWIRRWVAQKVEEINQEAQ